MDGPENTGPTPVPQPHGGAIYQGGVPGNRGGGRKLITTLILEALEANDDALARSYVADLIKNARSGNGTAIKEVNDRAEGPVIKEHKINLGELPTEKLIEALKGDA